MDSSTFSRSSDSSDSEVRERSRQSIDNYLHSLYGGFYGSFEDFGNIRTSHSSSHDSDESFEEYLNSKLDPIVEEYFDLSEGYLCEFEDREISILADIKSTNGHYTLRTSQDELGLFDLLPEEILLHIISLVSSGSVLYKLADNFQGFNRLINLPGVLGHSKAKVLASFLGKSLALNIQRKDGELITGNDIELSNNFLTWFEGNFYNERLNEHTRAYYNLQHNLSYFDENPLPIDEDFQLLCSDTISDKTSIGEIKVFAKYGANVVLRECLTLAKTEKTRIILEVLSMYKIKSKEFILFIITKYASLYTTEVKKIAENNDIMLFSATELISFYENV